VNFAVLVAGDIETFSGYASVLGWDQLRLVSAADSDLKRVLGFETEDGEQRPGLSVFRLGDGGEPIHFTSSCAILAEDTGTGWTCSLPSGTSST
jgi:predicted dithiol-disulfide oxidoreductase (DUF899 family)